MLSFLSFSNYRAVVGCSCGLVLHMSCKQACRDVVLCHMCDLCAPWWMDGGAWKVALCPFSPKQGVIRECWLSCNAQRAGFAQGFAPSSCP